MVKGITGVYTKTRIHRIFILTATMLFPSMLKEQLVLKSCPALHVCAIMLDCVFLFMYQAGGTGVMVNAALQTCCSTSADMGLIYGSKERVRSVYV